jgi:hypothetical protein
LGQLRTFYIPKVWVETHGMGKSIAALILAGDVGLIREKRVLRDATDKAFRCPITVDRDGLCPQFDRVFRAYLYSF